jgi:hypothetical protein
MSKFVIESDGQNEDACGRRHEISTAKTDGLYLKEKLERLGFHDEAAGLADTLLSLQAEYVRVNDAILDWENRDGETDTRSSNWHHGRLGVDTA